MQQITAETEWTAAARAYDSLTPAERDAFISAEENACVTGGERGFAEHTPEWYAVWLAGWEDLTAELPV